MPHPIAADKNNLGFFIDTEWKRFVPFQPGTIRAVTLRGWVRCDSLFLLLVSHFLLIVNGEVRAMASIRMTDDELLAELNALRDTMVAVATGGPRIQTVQAEFETKYDAVDDELKRRRSDNTLPFRDLWQWYGRWSSDLPGYQSRRMYVAELFYALMRRIKVQCGKRHRGRTPRDGCELTGP